MLEPAIYLLISFVFIKNNRNFTTDNNKVIGGIKT